MSGKPPVIVIKKKGGHGSHHGGAWKVAYADFVTAMMALFIVLWLMNTSKKIQQAVSGYFKDPSGASSKLTVNSIGTGGTSFILTDNMEQLKAQLEKTISQVPNFDKLKDHIQMTITAEGLRIELLEEEKDTFFDSGSAELNANGHDMLVALAEQLGKLPNKISVEGHTDAQPYTHGKDYTNWELSSDRANSARRLLQESGVAKNQVTQVRGYADQDLRKPEAPFDPSNRRITLIVHYLSDESKSNIDLPDVGSSHPDSDSSKH